jgi:hypothetical protein
MVHVDRISYRGWSNCYSLWNETIEMTLTADVGPRVLRFGFIGQNELVEFPDQLGRTGGDEFRLYGGHRLWHAPESVPRTYYPDNAPVEVERIAEGVRLRPPVETTTGVQKEMEIRLSPTAPSVRILHRLFNRGAWPAELSAWALTAMAPGGTAVIPLPPRGRHPDDLRPSSLLAVWPYTDFSDPRWTLGRRYLLLRQDRQRPLPQKLGAAVPDGWVAHVRDGRLFVKSFVPVHGAAYPDFGSAAEVFADGAMLELETLGPITRVEPGGMVEHVERWDLWLDVPPPRGDDDVDTHIVPRIAGTRPAQATR